MSNQTPWKISLFEKNWQIWFGGGNKYLEPSAWEISASTQGTSAPAVWLGWCPLYTLAICWVQKHIFGEQRKIYILLFWTIFSKSQKLAKFSRFFNFLFKINVENFPQALQPTNLLKNNLEKFVWTILNGNISQKHSGGGRHLFSHKLKAFITTLFWHAPTGIRPKVHSTI